MAKLRAKTPNVEDQASRDSGAEEASASDGSTFRLAATFDVTGIVDTHAAATTWLAEQSAGNPARIVLEDPENVLTLQLAAAMHKSATAQGIAVSICGPSDASLDHISFDTPEGDAA